MHKGIYDAYTSTLDEVYQFIQNEEKKVQQKEHTENVGVNTIRMKKLVVIRYQGTNCGTIVAFVMQTT